MESSTDLLRPAQNRPMKERTPLLSGALTVKRERSKRRPHSATFSFGHQLSLANAKARQAGVAGTHKSVPRPPPVLHQQEQDALEGLEL